MPLIDLNPFITRFVVITQIKVGPQIFLYNLCVLPRYNTVWIANTEIGLDPSYKEVVVYLSSLFHTNHKENIYLLVYESRGHKKKWAAPSEFGTYRLCEQRRFRRACASAQSRQNLRCSLIHALSQEEPSDRKLDPWPLWMVGHAQLKFVMTECSKTQIRLTGLK